MNTASIVIIICLVVLNLVGMILWIMTNQDKKGTAEWWLNILWTLICGVVYIPFGIYKLIKKK